MGEICINNQKISAEILLTHRHLPRHTYYSVSRSYFFSFIILKHYFVIWKIRRCFPIIQNFIYIYRISSILQCSQQNEEIAKISYIWHILRK